jgi:anti-sigma factor RsiW
MRCKKVQDRLDDHVDGLLPAPEAEAIRDHLDLCFDCRETALALKAASASLSTWNDADAPPDCFDKILARIDALPPEALRHAPRRSLLPMMPRFDSADVARYRRVATGGLAAAAAVLGALVVARTETPSSVRRVAPRTAAPDAPVSPAGWYQNSYLDNGLFYERGDRMTWPRAPRGELLDASPR